MTAQAPDFLNWRDARWTICDDRGSGLWAPPGVIHPTCTANWRGFQCTYAVRRERLHLMRVRLAGERGWTLDQALVLLKDIDVLGHRATAVESGFVRYEIEEPFTYDGTLVVGDGLSHRFDGYLPDIRAFARALELRFEGGLLAEVRDLRPELGPRDPIPRRLPRGVHGP
jgi:hypothetical protein